MKVYALYARRSPYPFQLLGLYTTQELAEKDIPPKEEGVSWDIREMEVVEEKKEEPPQSGYGFF